MIDRKSLAILKFLNHQPAKLDQKSIEKALRTDIDENLKYLIMGEFIEKFI